RHQGMQNLSDPTAVCRGVDVEHASAPQVRRNASNLIDYGLADDRFVVLQRLFFNLYSLQHLVSASPRAANPGQALNKTTPQTNHLAIVARPKALARIGGQMDRSEECKVSATRTRAASARMPMS